MSVQREERGRGGSIHVFTDGFGFLLSNTHLSLSPNTHPQECRLVPFVRVTQNTHSRMWEWIMFTLNPLNDNIHNTHSYVGIVTQNTQLCVRINYVYVQPTQCQINSRQRWIAFTFLSPACHSLLVYLHSGEHIGSCNRRWIWYEYFGLFNLWWVRWSFCEWIWLVFCLCRNSRMPQTFSKVSERNRADPF